MNDGKTIKENNNQSASNELKIATNSTSCHTKTNGIKLIEWSWVKDEKEVCQPEETIGIIQKEDTGYVLIYNTNKKSGIISILNSSQIEFTFKQIRDLLNYNWEITILDTSKQLIQKMTYNGSKFDTIKSFYANIENIDKIVISIQNETIIISRK